MPGILGKTSRKITAVFATTREAADSCVLHLHSGVDLPIWLFTRESPSPEIAALCQRIITGKSAALWLRAQRELWPYRVALALGDWDGKRGNWLLKLAPVTIPFFRALLRNEAGDFFSGSPQLLGVHAGRRFGELSRSAAIRYGEWTLGAALYVFAFFAQWSSPLSRFVFSRIRGSEILALDAPPHGSGIARHRYTGREWKNAEITDLINNTEARYILLESEPELHADASDLLQAFRHPGTFAVSRQTAVRGWRKLLFCSAPFRALQPGEFSRVAAPIASSMLVDASKLGALGVPSLTSYGANWLLLFHQAAAAGWSSFSIGRHGKPTELPAVPFDYAEFVKTVLADPALRRLSTRQNVLARGSIAQSITPGPGFRGLPRVLIVSPYLPFPLSHGGAVRIWNLCRSLAPQVDFILACFREKDEVADYGKLHEVFRQVHVVDLDEKHRNPALPQQVNGYESGSMRALIGSLCAMHAIDALQIEYTQLAAYREASPDTPAILVEHDLTFTLYRQLAGKTPSFPAGREYQKWLRFERERFHAFDAVWTMSEFDRNNALAEGSPESRTVVVPNGVDLQRFNCRPAAADSFEVLYVGSFRHLPNYLGFEELRTVVMPAVWRRFPQATLRVVAGPNHTAHWPGPKSLDARIAVQGFTADLVPLYESAALAIVPLPVSAGTNIKLMEALSCERAVVTTPVGCAGLELEDGRDLLIRELGPAFADAVCELLADPGLRAEIARSGRQQAVSRFSWESIAERALASYGTLSPSFPSSRSTPHLQSLPS